MPENPTCGICGTTRIYILDSVSGEWVTDVLGYPSPMCPYCDEHIEMEEEGPKRYWEVYTRCYCCGEDVEAVENHHISYAPEVVRPVCIECHTRIHHDDSFRPDLSPDLTREDALEAGHIEPGYSEPTGEVENSEQV